MSERSRKSYLGLKLSPSEFFRRSVRWIKQGATRESQFEKPYRDEDYRLMHLNPPRPISPPPPFPEPKPWPELIVIPPLGPWEPPEVEPQTPRGSPSGPFEFGYIVRECTFFWEESPMALNEWYRFEAGFNPDRNRVTNIEITMTEGTDAEVVTNFTALNKKDGPRHVSVFLYPTAVGEGVLSWIGITIEMSLWQHAVSATGEQWPTQKSYEIPGLAFNEQPKPGCSTVAFILCVCEGGLEWDEAESDETIDRNDTAVVAVKTVIEGEVCGPPYRWSVTGTGFSMADERTSGLTNTLVADGTACGSATVTVTDCAGGTASGVVRCTEGQWGNMQNGCPSPGSVQGYDPQTLAYYSINGKYKQYQRLDVIGGFSASGDTMAECQSDVQAKLNTCKTSGACHPQYGCDECLSPACQPSANWTCIGPNMAQESPCTVYHEGQPHEYYRSDLRNRCWITASPVFQEWTC